MKIIERFKPYAETLSRSREYMIFLMSAGSVFIILTLLNLFGVWSPFSTLWFLLIYCVVILGSLFAFYPKMRSEMEITRVRSILHADMSAMAKEIETRILEIKNLWRQFSSRPIFCAAELEETRQTVYRKFLLYQKQRSALNSLQENSSNDEVREARAELDASIERTLNYLEETETRLNIVASQIALLEADTDVEHNSSLLTTIESLKESRKSLALAEKE